MKEGKNIEKKPKKSQLPKYLLAGLIGLQVIILAVTMIILKGRGGGEGGSSSSTGSLLPIWIAVFIPIIAARRKPASEEQRQKWLWILVGLTVLVLLTMTVFLLKALG